MEMRPPPRVTGTAANNGQASAGQIKLIGDMSRERGLEPPDFDGMTFADAKQEIDRLKRVPKIK